MEVVVVVRDQQMVPAGQKKSAVFCLPVESSRGFAFQMIDHRPGIIQKLQPLLTEAQAQVHVFPAVVIALVKAVRLKKGVSFHQQTGGGEDLKMALLVHRGMIFMKMFINMEKFPLFTDGYSGVFTVSSGYNSLAPTAATRGCSWALSRSSSSQPEVTWLSLLRNSKNSPRAARAP